VSDGFEDSNERDADASDLDDVGQWSIRKNDIVEYYAAVYARITRNAKAHFTRTYIDGFANRGFGRLKGTDEIVKGSALRVLDMPHPFDRYVLVEMAAKRAADLRKNVGRRPSVEILEADANEVLPASVLPGIRYDRFERALCFLDPYNMEGLRWETISGAGSNQAVDAIIHFPTMDAHRTVLRKDQGKISAAMRAKMNAYWGDESWFDDVYNTHGMLPMEGLSLRKREPEALIQAFKKRLVDVAGFVVVSNGIPMRNSTGNVIYHLLVCSHSKKAADVIRPLGKHFS
jgi:three-Cys-motif partner protein